MLMHGQYIGSKIKQKSTNVLFLCPVSSLVLPGSVYLPGRVTQGEKLPYHAWLRVVVLVSGGSLTDNTPHVNGAIF